MIPGRFLIATRSSVRKQFDFISKSKPCLVVSDSVILHLCVHFVKWNHSQVALGKFYIYHNIPSGSPRSPRPTIRRQKRKRICYSFTVSTSSGQVHEFEMLRSKFEMWGAKIQQSPKKIKMQLFVLSLGL